MRFLSTSLVFYWLSQQLSVDCFAPFSKTPSNLAISTRLFSGSLPDQTNVKVNGDINNRELSKEASVAVEALQRLMARQEAELEETKRLLELYNVVGFDPQSNIHNGIHQEKAKLLLEHGGAPELLSVASSVLKGADYGFLSRSEGPIIDLHGGNQAFVGYGPPANLWKLGTAQFMRNLKAMRNEYEEEQNNEELTPKQIELHSKLQQLTLNSTAIWERETKDGPIEAPWVIKYPYLMLCWMLDVVFEGKYVPSRFFLLETVARMPYFSYITMLHLYETLGFWRRSADMKRIHFAEELNEFRHLLIMESLGGDQRWWVRFVAQHSAIVYYFGLCHLWALSPSLSYKFSELLETHAVNTYGQFLDENEELLKELPPSKAAIDYYSLGLQDPYYAEFQTSAISKQEELRRPGIKMHSLYDVFSAIRDDEGDHVSTMEACLDPTVPKVSSSIERKVLTGIAAAAAVTVFLNTGSDVSVTTDLIDGLPDAAVTDGVASGVIDAVIAGAAGLASQLRQDTELEESLLEGGMMVNARAILTELAAMLARLL